MRTLHPMIMGCNVQFRTWISLTAYWQWGEWSILLHPLGGGSYAPCHSQTMLHYTYSALLPQSCRRAHSFLSARLLILVSISLAWVLALGQPPTLDIRIERAINTAGCAPSLLLLSQQDPPWQPWHIHSQEWESLVDPKNLSQTVQSCQ